MSLEGGEPTYDIRVDRAYDHIVPPGGALRCDLLYHGTLALRGPRCAQALTAVRSGAGQVFLDVNLRNPWWDREQVLGLVDEADWVKLNRDELDLLQGSEAVRGSQDLAARAAAFREAHGIVGRIVEYCLDKSKELSAMTLPEFRKFHTKFDKGVIERLQPASSVNLRKTIGGTSLVMVEERIREI